MKKYSIIFYGILFMGSFINTTSAKAQQSSCSYEKVAQIPLLDEGGYLLGTVRINGNFVRMVIDTGSEGSLISSKGVEMLHLPIDPNRQTVVHGSRGGQSLVSNIFIQQINLGSLTIGPLSVPLGNLPGYPRVIPPVVGLIGGDILSHFDLEFDVQAQHLVLWSVRSQSMICQLPPFWGKGMQDVDIQKVGHRPFVGVKVNNYSIVALLDSGARSRILSLQKAIQIGISYERLSADPGGVASGIDMHDTIYHWHRFQSFQLGRYIEYLPVLTVSPLHDSTDMLIGSDWFASRHVWISYQRDKLFFKDNKHKKK